eukprot:12993300-Heterocapsa_arctica.AAC.1
MEDLQEPDLLQMRHYRQGRDGNRDSQRKGPTIMFIGMLKAELPNWADLTVKQHIGRIGQFLMSNRTERLMLL